MIEFLCPNGHRVLFPGDRAGQSGTCPTCDARFIIPTPGGETVAQAAAASAAGGAANVGRPAAKDREIEFLCPNGHLLHGPARLQGKTGECPECKMRFQIPHGEDAPAPASSGAGDLLAKSGASDTHLPPFDESRLQKPTAPARNSEVTNGGSGSSAKGSSLKGEGSTAPASKGSVHVLPQIVLRLWPEKTRGAVLEVHLKSGEKIIPRWMAKGISQQSHAVFAVQSLDRTHTITVVPWDEVARIELRGVRTLPEGMIE